MIIQLQIGDITAFDGDALVNAAAPSLLGGGGVDGAIHAAAGEELLAECRALGGCKTGEAKLTRGYRLKARHIIHTVGPVWKGGKRHEDDLLRSSYRSCLRIAAENGFRSVAFPAISCGVYGYPIPQACRISVDTLIEFAQESPLPEIVTLTAFSRPVYESWNAALGGSDRLIIPAPAVSTASETSAAAPNKEVVFIADRSE